MRFRRYTVIQAWIRSVLQQFVQSDQGPGWISEARVYLPRYPSGALGDEILVVQREVRISVEAVGSWMAGSVSICNSTVSGGVLSDESDMKDLEILELSDCSAGWCSLRSVIGSNGRLQKG